MKTIDVIKALNKQLDNTPDFYERVDDELFKIQISELVYQARTNSGLDQEQLAETVDIDPIVIASLEDADYDGDSLEMLQRIASALNKQICIDDSKSEIYFEAPAFSPNIHLSQLLLRNFDEWLRSGWQTAQSLNLNFQPPRYQHAGARSRSDDEIDPLEAEIATAEKLANIDPNHQRASVRVVKRLNQFAPPMILAVSVSQAESTEFLTVLLQLKGFNEEDLPVGTCMTLLNDQEEFVYFDDAPDEVFEDRVTSQTKVLYLPFQYEQGDRFSIEISQVDISIREQFVV